jgi:hypothetical protein
MGSWVLFKKQEVRGQQFLMLEGPAFQKVFESCSDFMAFNLTESFYFIAWTQTCICLLDTCVCSFESYLWLLGWHWHRKHLPSVSTRDEIRKILEIQIMNENKVKTLSSTFWIIKSNCYTTLRITLSLMFSLNLTRYSSTSLISSPRCTFSSGLKSGRPGLTSPFHYNGKAWNICGNAKEKTGEAINCRDRANAHLKNLSKLSHFTNQSHHKISWSVKLWQISTIRKAAHTDCNKEWALPAPSPLL